MEPISVESILHVGKRTILTIFFQDSEKIGRICVDRLIDKSEREFGIEVYSYTGVHEDWFKDGTKFAVSPDPERDSVLLLFSCS